MASDPRTYGARCDECWLREHRVEGPVSTELKTGTSALVVADYPSLDDAKSGRILSGEAGIELERALEATGKSRSAVSITSVVLCHPQGGDMDKVIRAFKKENKRLEKEGEALMPTPNECCRPRLHAEMRAMAPHMGGTLNLVTLGKGAFSGVARKSCSIFDIRGGPHTAALRHDGSVIEGEQGSVDVKVVAALAEQMDAAGNVPTPSVPLQIVPTLDPFMVTKARRWTRAFRSDVGRAIRWFEGRLGWEEPWAVLRPTPAQVREFFESLTDEVSYDVETDALEPLKAKLRCVGFSTAQGGIVIPFLSRDGVTRFYTDREEAEIKQLIVGIFTNPNIFKTGHNCVYTGTPVLLGDGTSQSIESLAREGYEGDVLALDAEGRLIKSPVKRFYRVRKEGQPWVVIRREGEKAHARGLTVTPDHLVLTQRGLVRAEEVVVGDTLFDREPLLTHDMQCALLGTLLGDSSIIAKTSKPGPVRGRPIKVDIPRHEAERAMLRGCHYPHALAEEKNQWLGGLLTLAVRKQSSSFANSHDPMTYATGQMRQVADLARIVYDETGKRRINGRILSLLGPVGLAWLFADDGFKHTRPDRSRETVLIATCGFPDEDIEDARAWFEQKYGPTTITQEGSLRLGIEASQIFAEEIAPYLLPSMRYKLPKGEWPAFAGFPERETRPLPVPVESVEYFFPPRETARQRMDADTRWCLETEAGNFLTGFGAIKNCGSYDRMVIEQHFGVTPAPIIDGLVVHKSVEPELPHGLGYVGSMYTDVLSWKAGHTATQAATDEELWRYNLTDCVVVARSLPHTLQAAALRNQEYTIAQDHRVQSVCVGLHRVGQLIDQERRHEHDVRLLKDAQKFYTQCVALAGIGSKFNPGSAHQVRDLLFEKWDLSVPTTLGKKKAYTKSGDPSTGDDMILALRTSGRLTPAQNGFLDALRKYRKAAKLRGSYILPLRPQNSMYVLDKFAMELDLDEDDLDPNPDAPTAYAFFEDRFSKDNKKRGLVWADGRVRADYNIGPTTGRLSCSGGINLQTPPEKLRDMFVPGDGMVFVYADADQLELRLIAALAHSARYLDIFNNGGDAHAISASLAFGAKFDVLQKDSPDWESMRKFAKILSYASGYGANIDTVLDVIRSVEDDAGNLLYANVTKAEATKIHSNWLEGAGVRDWWERNMDTFRKQKYMAEPVWGRRRDFLDGEDFCAIQNFGCQAGGAAIMHEAVLEVVDAIPFEKWGPGTGLVNYMHDAVLVACPEKEADKVVEIVNAAMNRSTPALPVRFTSKAKIKKRWSEPKKKA